MKPVEFKEQNVVYAKDQKEYLDLPSYRDKATGRVISCWKLSLFERLKLLFTGRLWLHILAFNNPLQASKLSADSPFPYKFMGEVAGDETEPKTEH